MVPVEASFANFTTNKNRSRTGHFFLHPSARLCQLRSALLNRSHAWQDQTNVYKNARQRKAQAFKDFGKRTCVTLVNDEEQLAQRTFSPQKRSSARRWGG